MELNNSLFTFKGFSLDKIKGNVIFSYTLTSDDKTYNFSETIVFPVRNINWLDISDSLLDNVLNNLMLMLGISYWKLTCAKKKVIESFKLSEKQAEFWNKVYTKGLGEFFYKNRINFKNYVNFPNEDNVSINLEKINNRGESLVFFGGGKDSIVSSELLKKYHKPFTLFMTEESEIQKQTAELIESEKIVFQRTLDPQLFVLNKQPGFYNGHIPISAVWALLGVLAAVLYGYKYVISSNEFSANYGNVQYLGEEINHQWSKSYEFEILFNSYVNEYISPDITYFSLLRPFHEIKIMEIFIKYPKYFPFFSSCNRNFKIHNKLTGTNWCGECPKCVFVFILLAAFLSQEEVLTIFGKNLFEEDSLLKTVKELAGVESFKPFECVGTPEETQLALYYIYKKGSFNNSKVMQFFVDELQNKIDVSKLEKEVMISKNISNIPKNFKDIIQSL